MRDNYTGATIVLDVRRLCESECERVGVKQAPLRRMRRTSASLRYVLAFCISSIAWQAKGAQLTRPAGGT